MVVGVGLLGRGTPATSLQILRRLTLRGGVGGTGHDPEQLSAEEAAEWKLAAVDVHFHSEIQQDIDTAIDLYGDAARDERANRGSGAMRCLLRSLARPSGASSWPTSSPPSWRF